MKDHNNLLFKTSMGLKLYKVKTFLKVLVIRDHYKNTYNTAKKDLFNDHENGIN